MTAPAAGGQRPGPQLAPARSVEERLDAIESALVKLLGLVDDAIAVLPLNMQRRIRRRSHGN